MSLRRQTLWSTPLFVACRRKRTNRPLIRVMSVPRRRKSKRLRTNYASDHRHACTIMCVLSRQTDRSVCLACLSDAHHGHPIGRSTAPRMQTLQCYWSNPKVSFPVLNAFKFPKLSERNFRRVHFRTNASYTMKRTLGVLLSERIYRILFRCKWEIIINGGK